LVRGGGGGGRRGVGDFVAETGGGLGRAVLVNLQNDVIRMAMMLASTVSPAFVARGARKGSRQAVKCSAAADGRPVWFPGNAPPTHLDGSLPGDYGFDPLRIGADAKRLAWMQQAELQHARRAMAGVVGIVFQEGFRPDILWTEAGAQPVFGPPDMMSTQQDIYGLVAAQILLMGWAEHRRLYDIRSPGSCNEDPLPHRDMDGKKYAIPADSEVGYPGGRMFDPLGMASDKSKYAVLKVKEIKNGRLAMVAIVGFAAQASALHQGPIACLKQHLSDPGHNTIFNLY